MNVQEVSLVDRAANERKFAIAKRDGAMPKMTKAEWAAKATVVKAALAEVMAKLAGSKAAGVAKLEFALPTEAKQSLMDGLADALDRLTALATMVGDAQVNDSAPVPPELVSALVQVAELLEGTASQFGPPPEQAQQQPPAPPPPPPAGAQDPQGKRLAKAELDNLTAASVTIGAARERLWGATDLMGKDPSAAAEALRQVVGMLDSAAGFLGQGGAPQPPAPGTPEEGALKALLVAKGLPAELNDGDSMKELREGDSLKELLQKAQAAAIMLDVATNKAGRKISGKRFEKLKTLHSGLGDLLNELAHEVAGDAVAEPAEKAGAVPSPAQAAPAQAAPPVPPKKRPEQAAPPVPPVPAQKNVDGADAAKPADDPAVAELKKRIADGEEARAKLEKQVAELSKRAGVPMSAAPEGGSREPGDVQWPQDMSDHVVAKRKAEAAKAAAK